MEITNIRNALPGISFTLLASLFIFYWIVLITYRLILHPLAKFPGPKLAASTRLYEFYYDSICHGRFWKEIERMHEHHGPIVRINPFEIHINDPEYVKELLNTNKDLDKDPLRVRSIGQAQNIQETVEWDLHKRRRAPFDGFFSRKRITELSGLINRQADQLVGAIQSDISKGQAAVLSSYYRFATAETIFDYCFGRTFGLFEDQERATNMCVNFARPGDFRWGHHLGRFTPYINVIIEIQRLLYKANSWITGVPPQLSFVGLHDYGRDRLKEVLGPKKEKVEDTQDTVFHRIASSDLPEEERTPKMMMNNIFLFLTAGFDTTAYNLTLATYYALTHPDIKRRLQIELATAPCFEQSEFPLWHELERLPLLHAVIKETLRLGSGVLSRLSRQSPRSSLVYGDWVIPPTYPVSVSPPLIHSNPELFPYPEMFDPDRWLQPNSAELDKYLIPFSRGSRGCIGMNLAMAEFHIFFAAVFRRFDGELVNTTSDNVVSYHDDFTPSPRNGKQILFLKARHR